MLEGSQPEGFFYRLGKHGGHPVYYHITFLRRNEKITTAVEYGAHLVRKFAYSAALESIVDESRGIHDRRDADRDHRNSGCLFRDLPSGVSDSGAGAYPRIRDLYGRGKPVETARTQRVDHDQRIRLNLGDPAFDYRKSLIPV